MKKDKFKEKEIEIITYEPHQCEYTMLDDCLFTRKNSSEEWVEVNYSACIVEGRNHYEVYKHFGKEKWYVDYLFYFISYLKMRIPSKKMWP